MQLNKYIYNLSNLIRKVGFNFNELNDERVISMRKEMATIGKIEFKIEQYPDGSWTAESINIDGIMTGGKHNKNISSVLKDAVFTYFEIPAYLCVDTLLKGDSEPVTIRQNVYV